ncbi:hypothetical protein PQX77_018090 [Marasmius sp. AFHP31]|nr:hypothetical protein PQX77_018090 [Marasmius sp. AFHP31]
MPEPSADALAILAGLDAHHHEMKKKATDLKLNTGTRLHQHTWKNISRHTKSLENNMCKFNKYCVQLEGLSQAHPDAPLVVPQQLSLQLNALQDNDTCNLWEDMWVLQETSPPQWLVDEKVRHGIRLVHALDRSLEEREWLSRELQHLLQWFTIELQAL